MGLRPILGHITCKLTLAVPKTTFIIAIDDAVIKYSVKKTYPKIEEDDFGIVDNYIEKIIQLPIYIPELSENDIINYLSLLVVQLYFDEKIVKELSEKLTEKNVFFSGVALNESNIKEYVPNIMREGVIKKGDYKEFIEIFRIISGVSKVISCDLKGNPRQAKRFLNTFIVRKKLGEIYYRGKENHLDYNILAELTALEYMDKSLFRELYKACMTKSNSEKVKELEILKEFVQNNEDFTEQFREWDKPKIKNWLKNSKIDVGGTELLRYFYLSRESLHINYSAVDELTLEERKAYNAIMQQDRPVIFKKLIDDLKEKADVNYNNVIDAIIESFRENYKIINKCLTIFITFEEKRSKIVDVILEMKLSDISASSLTMFNGMYKVDKLRFNRALDYFEEIGITKEQIAVITKEE